MEALARVRYPRVLPGVDVVYYGTGQQRIEYDLVLEPGTDPQDLVLAFDGARSIALADDGSAVLRLTNGAEIVQPAPVAYQVDTEGSQRRVEAKYELRKGGIGFRVGRFDHSKKLVIDPAFVYSTYLGGQSTDQTSDMALDSAGEVVIVGATTSSRFPMATGYHGIGPNFFDAFVAKLNATGSALVYATYLGGDYFDAAWGVAVDSIGNAYSSTPSW